MSGSLPSSDIRHVLLRPTDESGAEFEIESVRLTFRKEYLASIPSGVSWQGLSEIYRETLVTRSPEIARFALTLPERPWLDLAVGTVEEAPVTFRVGIARPGETETILGEQKVTEAHRWQLASVDLDEFAGEEITLSLSLDADTPGALGFWGAPAVRNRRSMSAAADAGNPPQGVILILGDSLRRDHLDVYGYERPTAPNLKQMAEQGVLFLDNQSQADFTKVSVPSILSSLYQSTHGIVDILDRLPNSAVTIAEVFREAGYATWSSAANDFTGKMSNLHQGVEVLHEPGSVVLPDGLGLSKNAQTFTDRLLPWLELHRDTPFFVFLHALDPHPPFETYAPYATEWADPAWRDQHYSEMDKVRPFIGAGIFRRLAMAKRKELEQADIDTDRFVAREIDWYDGSILAMDAEVGRIFKKLRELELEESTVVGFISDHGEEFLDHDMHFNSNNIYGEMTNVPLILWGPGRVSSGKVIDETVQSIDLAPTLIDLAGLPVPETMQGRSLAPLLSADDPGRAEGWLRRPAVSERTRSAALRDPETANAVAIVWEGWKLIHNKERPEGYPEYELFDHRNDPLNFINVAAEHPNKVEELKGHLEGWRQWVGAQRLPTDAEFTEGVSSEELERLRSLGYVQ
jgi:arylsulfatase A-like enzyme